MSMPKAGYVSAYKVGYVSTPTGKGRSDMAKIGAGRYRAKVRSIEAVGRLAGSYLEWTWATKGGSTIKTRTSLERGRLLDLRGHLVGLGYTGRIDVETDDLIGSKAVLVIDHGRVVEVKGV